ncbi:MAG: hypothetical protein EOP50_05900 [Sphingobacteriales bacterium]|nr:MAG: hypothetical protein EOP50_05900 [Sphingobacteriales bacterium]
MNAAFAFILHLMVFLSGGRTPGLQHLAPVTSNDQKATAAVSAPQKQPMATGVTTAATVDRSTSDGTSLSDDLTLIDTEDEDESDPFPLVLLSCCLVALATAGLLPVHACTLRGRTSPYYKHFSFLGTDRYIAYCVFRI